MPYTSRLQIMMMMVTCTEKLVSSTHAQEQKQKTKDPGVRLHTYFEQLTETYIIIVILYRAEEMAKSAKLVAMRF